MPFFCHNHHKHINNPLIIYLAILGHQFGFINSLRFYWARGRTDRAAPKLLYIPIRNKKITKLELSCIKLKTFSIFDTNKKYLANISYL